MLFAGFNVVRGPLLACSRSSLVGTVANLVGSWIAYAVGYFGRIDMLEKHGAKLHIKPSHLAWADRWFERYGDATVFFTRMLPIIRTFISLPAGRGADAVLALHALHRRSAACRGSSCSPSSASRWATNWEQWKDSPALRRLRRRRHDRDRGRVAVPARTAGSAVPPPLTGCRPPRSGCSRARPSCCRSPPRRTSSCCRGLLGWSTRGCRARRKEVEVALHVGTAVALRRHAGRCGSGSLALPVAPAARRSGSCSRGRSSAGSAGRGRSPRGWSPGSVALVVGATAAAPTRRGDADARAARRAAGSGSPRRPRCGRACRAPARRARPRGRSGSRARPRPSCPPRSRCRCSWRERAEGRRGSSRRGTPRRRARRGRGARRPPSHRCAALRASPRCERVPPAVWAAYRCALWPRGRPSARPPQSGAVSGAYAQSGVDTGAADRAVGALVAVLRTIDTGRAVALRARLRPLRGRARGRAEPRDRGRDRRRRLEADRRRADRPLRHRRDRLHRDERQRRDLRRRRAVRACSTTSRSSGRTRTCCARSASG